MRGAIGIYALFALGVALPVNAQVPPYEDGKYPPQEALIRAKLDLYSRGGCSNDAAYQQKLDSQYKARLDAVFEALVARYGPIEPRREVIIAGGCHPQWTERRSRQLFEAELVGWERSLRLPAAAR